MGYSIINKNRSIKIILMIFIGITTFVKAYAYSPDTSNPIQRNRSLAEVNSRHPGEVIVLIHGLMRTYVSMKPLKAYLEAQGYQVYLYKYPSARYNIQEHGVYLNQFITTILENNPAIKIHFVTHSLGGIIVREALSKLSQKQLKHVGYLIMLAPPNQGSKLAKFSIKLFPMISYFIKPLPELSSEQTSYVHRVPVPDIKMGIIAGRFDAKVPPDYARLQGQTEQVIINNTHTFIMYDSKVKKLVLSFLEKGKFE
ncbi:TPA: lipase family alpha/beta hydrolase [Legionella pneumophila]